MIRWLGIFSILVLMCGCSLKNKKERYVALEGVVWHTSFRIVYQGVNDLSGDVMAVLEDVEQSLSPFKKESLISMINRNESSEIDENIRSVFAVSADVNKRSGGVFDPTVAPLINLWGFGYKDAVESPSDEDLSKCLKSVGLNDCEIAGNHMIKKDSATEFNFSAVTKGYGVDCVANMFESKGVKNYLIEIGGEVFAKGVNQEGNAWRVSVDAPLQNAIPGDKTIAVIELKNQAVATSGNYRNYHLENGELVGHTISPKTGLPVKTSVASATVVAPTCAYADAIATALMAMNKGDIPDFIANFDGKVSAMIIELTEKEEFVLEMFGDFPLIDEN